MKRRILFILSVLLVSAVTASAQDIITKKNGEDIKAKVLEIDNSNVKYKLFDEPNGVTYTMPKTQILMIRHESGRNEVFGSGDVEPLFKEIPEGIVPGMKYRQLKKIYNYKDYEPGFVQRHRKPVGCGVASFFIPGLGQLIEGEVGRGLAWLGGSLVSSAFAGVGIYLLNADIDEGFFYENDVEGVFILVGVLGSLAVDVCSIIDAVRIAKVQNLYYSDLKRKDYTIELHPSVNYFRTVSGGVQPTAGFTLAMRF